MNLLPSLARGKFIVLCAPHAARDESAVLAAELALRGSVTVLDGGNRFLPYRVAHLLRLKTVDVQAASNRLFIRRAFTCYEVNSLLAETRALDQPCLILDLLHTFYDDHVPVHEAERLLRACLSHIQRLGRAAPLIVTLAPPLVKERACLIEQVCQQADQLLLPEADPSPQPLQPSLFPLST